METLPANVTAEAEVYGRTSLPLVNPRPSREIGGFKIGLPAIFAAEEAGPAERDQEELEEACRLAERIEGYDGIGRHRLVDFELALRESAPGERERRFAQAEENAARQQAETADLQDRLATEERYVEGLREGIAEMDRLSAVLQEGMDRLATMRAQRATDTTANAQGVEPASHSEAEP